MFSLFRRTTKRNLSVAGIVVEACVISVLVAAPMISLPATAKARPFSCRTNSSFNLTDLVTGAFSSASFPDPDYPGLRRISLVFSVNTSHVAFDCLFTDCDGRPDRIKAIPSSSPNACNFVYYDCNQIRIDVSRCNADENVCINLKLFYQEDWNPSLPNNPYVEGGFIFIPSWVFDSNSFQTLTSNLTDSSCE